MLSFFQLFRLFDFFGTPPNITYSITFLSPNLLSTMLVARSTLSDAPGPLYTSTHVVAAAHIAVEEICLPEKKAWQIPELRNTAPAPSNNHQRHRRHDGLRNGMRDAIAHQQ